MADIMKNAKGKYGFVTKELNTGGGYGIPYTEEAGKDLNYFTDPIINEVDKNCVEYNLERPLVIIEPGRWIVGEAGITLYTIGNIKKIPKLKTYVSVDGGMLDNPRPSLYGAKYQAVLANKINEPANNTVTIAGKYCESGDILIWDLRLPKVESGDILVVFTTGAYNYSMSSNYNRIPRPAVVMLSQGKDRVIVKRETYEDIIRNDI
jgi:diaminopimelate decarboxylase